MGIPASPGRVAGIVGALGAAAAVGAAMGVAAERVLVRRAIRADTADRVDSDRCRDRADEGE